MNRREFLWTAGGSVGLAGVVHGQDPPSPPQDQAKARQVEGTVVSAPFSPVNIGTSAQLFVERSIVRDTERVWFSLHPGEKHPSNPLIRADRDWEGWRLKTYGNAIFDEDEKVFKIWYDSHPSAQYFDQQYRYSLYATSHDGVRWEKPLAGTIESSVLGRRHNVVLKAQFANVIKDYAETDPARRYKALCLTSVTKQPARCVYHSYISPDGLQWNQLPGLVRDDGKDVVTAYYDELRKVWVAFFKKKPPIRGIKRRCFLMMYSRDFTQWSEPQFVFVPDDQDDAGSWARLERVRAIREVPENPALIRTEFYGVGAHVAESCTIAFPWVFTVNNNGVYGNQDGPIEIQIAASRDLLAWQRHFRTPCILPGGIGEWDSGLFYTQSKAIRRSDEIWLYYAASNFTHAYPGRHTKEHGSAKTTSTGSIGLVKWKLDRFVSADAGPNGGLLTTVPFTYAGRRLELNARVLPGGSIRAEFLDAVGRPILEAGLSSPSDEDSLRSRIAWARNEEIVDRLKGKPVSLRFHLRNAELYSFAFRA